MKCPHCLTSFHHQWALETRFRDADGNWRIDSTTCPACMKVIIRLQRGSWGIGPAGNETWTTNESIDVRPLGSSRAPCPPEVPKEIAEDYAEACTVLPFSAKAAAALSRRCLQAVLRESGIQKRTLAEEIEEYIGLPSTPTLLSESVDAVRNVGNFAAHPMKSSSSGEILPVEPGEAEWTLDVLEALFDHLYVQPARLKKKRAALDKKLGEAGKPPLK